MKLFEILGILVVAVVIFNVMKLLLRLMIEYLAYKQDSRFSRKSEYREAFIMECSEDMLEDSENEYARQLDKVITFIDKSEEDIRKRRAKLDKKISKLSC